MSRSILFTCYEMNIKKLTYLTIKESLFYMTNKNQFTVTVLYKGGFTNSFPCVTGYKLGVSKANSHLDDNKRDIVTISTISDIELGYLDKDNSIVFYGEDCCYACMNVSEILSIEFKPQ